MKNAIVHNSGSVGITEYLSPIDCSYLGRKGTQKQTRFQQQVFIYSRPIAGRRAKMEHETTYLQTSKWHVKIIFMHLGFKYHTDQRAYYQLSRAEVWYSADPTGLIQQKHSCPGLHILPKRCTIQSGSTILSLPISAHRPLSALTLVRLTIQNTHARLAVVVLKWLPFAKMDNIIHTRWGFMQRYIHRNHESRESGYTGIPTTRTLTSVRSVTI